ncbi:MAG: hypothetical protein WBQ59_28470 [Candidatus Acidiferrum sp.]
MKQRIAKATGVCALLALLFLTWPPVTKAQTIQVDATPSHVANTFSPPYALGSTVDRVPSNATDPFFKPEAIQKILSAGWGAISYRQIRIYSYKRGTGTQRAPGAIQQVVAISPATPIPRK